MIGNSQENLAEAVSHFLDMINRPDRMGKEIDTIIKGLGDMQLSPEAQGCMDKVVKSLRSLLPKEYQDTKKETMEDMVRAILEENHI